MNQFNLPGCLMIEEGACERLNEILADCIPGIEKKRTVIATEEALIPIMKPYLDEMKRDLPESEIYLIEENSFGWKLCTGWKILSLLPLLHAVWSVPGNLQRNINFQRLMEVIWIC